MRSSIHTPFQCVTTMSRGSRDEVEGTRAVAEVAAVSMAIMPEVVEPAQDQV
jgi:hypothetical protein